MPQNVSGCQKAWKSALSSHCIVVGIEIRALVMATALAQERSQPLRRFSSSVFFCCLLEVLPFPGYREG